MIKQSYLFVKWEKKCKCNNKLNNKRIYWQNLLLNRRRRRRRRRKRRKRNDKYLLNQLIMKNSHQHLHLIKTLNRSNNRIRKDNISSQIMMIMKEKANNNNFCSLLRVFHLLKKLRMIMSKKLIVLMKFHHQYHHLKNRKKKRPGKININQLKHHFLVGSKRRKMRDLRNRNRKRQTRKKSFKKS